MNILVDVDGILADLVGDMCTELNRQGLGPISPGNFARYEFEATLDPHQLHAAEQWLSEPGTCAALRWYLGSHGFLAQLKKLGNVYALTAPYRNSATWAAERALWLRKHIPANCVLSVPSSAKPLVRGAVLIEDNANTARDWALANPEGLACVLARPWNRPIDCVDGMAYCDSYDAIIRAIGGLS